MKKILICLMLTGSFEINASDTQEQVRQSFYKRVLAKQFLRTLIMALNHFLSSWAPYVFGLDNQQSDVWWGAESLRDNQNPEIAEQSKQALIMELSTLKMLLQHYYDTNDEQILATLKEKIRTSISKIQLYMQHISRFVQRSRRKTLNTLYVPIDTLIQKISHFIR
jgi:hypothetical protein